MADISKIDRNFKVESGINKSDVVFYSALSAPLKVYGVFYENGSFRRLPEAVAKTVSAGVYALHANTAGGRVRFRTDSPYIAIKARMSGLYRAPHFTLCGSAGFDLYVGTEYTATFMPPYDMDGGYEKVVELGEGIMRDITIDLPLYSGIDELYIGLKAGSEVCEPKPYRIEKPIVYYGSSITQGGCASRPGNSYQGFVTRALDVNHTNLGFSGNAKGEREISDYIKGLDMTAFVYDYDYNAPTPEHLEATHERMFLEIREANPELPIILMSRPWVNLNDVWLRRLAIIRKTYENAIARGDRNVYFIDGRNLMRLAGREGTVDACHPNDLGFFSMASALTDLLSKII